MSLTMFQNGVSSYGIPLTGLAPQIPRLTSDPKPQVLFVDSENGANANAGDAPDNALATITAALAKCVSGDLNIIFVLPGTYVENVVVTKDYVCLIGAAGGGYGRPDVVPTTGKALVVQAAQGFVCARMRFAIEAVDSDTVLQEGNGFLYYDCVFDGDAAQGATKANLRLKGNANNDNYTASEGKIINCLFRGAGGVGLVFDTGNAPTNGVGCTDDVVEGCTFQANDLDIATDDTGAGVYSVQVSQIRKNYFVDKNKATYIDLTTTNGGAAGDQTGAIEGNYFASDTITTTKIKMVGTGFTFTGNYYTVGIADGSSLD